MLNLRRFQRLKDRARHGLLLRCAWESLETRTLLSAAATSQPLGEITSISASATKGLTPLQVRQAYGLTNATLSNGTLANGAGQTIAIIDAFNDPTLAADLSVFDSAFGLAGPASLKVVDQNGGNALPATDALWASEITLDVEWAHATAPGSSILLVEAKSNQLSDLLAAVDTARKTDGVTAVSMSWGVSEFAAETTLDSRFTTADARSGITFVASTGDNGPGSIQWPAASPNVLAVGGTTLSSVGGSDKAYAGSGSGQSAYEPQPAFQAAVDPLTARSVPDVALDADPATGYCVYGTTKGGGWQVAGGTSAGAPQWSGLVAIADQVRKLNGKPSLDGATQTLPELYGLAAAGQTTAFTPLTTLTTTSSVAPAVVHASANAIFSTTTGLGTPNADSVIASLASTTRRAKHHVLHGGPPPTSGTGSPGGPTATPGIVTPPPVATVPNNRLILPNPVTPAATPSPFDSRATVTSPLTQIAHSPLLTKIPGVAAVSAGQSPGTRSFSSGSVFSAVPISMAHVAESLVAVASSELTAALDAIENAAQPPAPASPAETTTPDQTPATTPAAARALVNLFHVNAATVFADSMNAFINDSAAPATHAPISHRRAWQVTTLAIAADLALVAYWYHARRKDTAPTKNKPRNPQLGGASINLAGR